MVKKLLISKTTKEVDASAKKRNFLIDVIVKNRQLAYNFFSFFLYNHWNEILMRLI